MEGDMAAPTDVNNDNKCTLLTHAVVYNSCLSVNLFIYVFTALVILLRVLRIGSA
jgi:hypothetical protein